MNKLIYEISVIRRAIFVAQTYHPDEFRFWEAYRYIKKSDKGEIEW